MLKTTFIYHVKNGQLWRRNHTNDRFGACEAIVDAIAQEYPFYSANSMFDDFEKLEFENDSSNCLDIEEISCVKNLSLPLYFNDDENYDDEELINDLDIIIYVLATDLIYQLIIVFKNVNQ